jgi:hypothetical protein
MTILQKIALGLSMVSLIISTGAVIISYRAMRRSSKALKDTQEEALKITDEWSIYQFDKVDKEIEINEDDYIDAW